MELLLLLTFTLSAQGQLSVTWNGNTVQSDTITDPVLIYFEDITVDNTSTTIEEVSSDHSTPGTLICRSEDRDLVSWDNAAGFSVAVRPDGNLIGQIRTEEGVTPSLSQLVLNEPDSADEISNPNGIWHCRLNRVSSTSFERQINVGIYSREDQGAGVIYTSQSPISLASSSFGSDPPTFTLVGDTDGGPPTDYNWTRNGQVITRNASYSISFALRGTSRDDYEQARYRSTLIVTGTLPGVYQYSVTNNATTGTRTSSFTIEGTLPTNVTAMQTGENTVQVSWTGPLAGRYRVIADPGGGSVDFALSPQAITLLPGVYNISVMSFSQHYPEEPVGPVQVTVRGILGLNVATSSLTATSVTVSWTQRQFSFTPVDYTVTPRRVTGSGQVLCSTVEDNRPPVTIMPTVTSMQFTGLQEFSTYRVTVTARFSDIFGLSPSVPTSMEFMTLSDSPIGAPRDVTPTTAPRSIIFTWTAIECIERNGGITGYNVVFWRVGGTATTNEQVVDRSFTASELQPFTDYTFQVQGVNDEGTGPFTTAILTRTDEDVPGAVSNFIAVDDVTVDDVILVRFTWSAPVEPNGIIIAYELNYTVNNTDIARNTTDVSTTMDTIELDINTNVTDISIRAYTSAGPGTASMADNVFISSAPQPVVINIQVMQVPDSETSVIVSWKRSSGNVTHYTVYYSPVSGRKRQAEMSQMVPGTMNLTRINGLVSRATYQFEVIVTIKFRGKTIVGERNGQDLPMIMLEPVATQLLPTTMQEKTTGGCVGESTVPIISVLVTFVLTVSLYTSLLLLGYCALRARRANPSKESVTTIAMEENAAYGPVTSSQQPHDYSYTQPDCKTESEYDIVK